MGNEQKRAERRYHRKAWKLWVVGALLVPVLAVELGVRLAHDSTRGTYFDDRGLYRLLADDKVWGEELLGDHATNSYGFVSDELADPRPPNGYRVFVMSDTSSLSFKIPRIIEHSLRQRYPGRAIEVVNVSSPRYTTAHHLQLLRETLVHLKPDCLVLNLGINDNIYNTDLDARVPHSGIFDARTLTASVAWQMMVYEFLDKPARRTSFIEAELRSRDIFEANIRRIIEIAQSHGIDIVLLQLGMGYPTEDLALLAKIRTWQPKVAHAWGDLPSATRGVSAHRRVVANLAREFDLPVSDMGTVLPRDSAHFIDLVHMGSGSGPETFARHVAGIIVEAGLLDKSEPHPPG